MSKKKKRHPAPASGLKSQSDPPVKTEVEPLESPGGHGIWSEPLALGLGLLIVLRPWRDGLTFVAFNAYAYALVLVLAAFWCVRGVLRPAPLRTTVPVALFGGFLLVAWLTSFTAYAYEPADRALQHLAACFLVFAMASNGLRTRKAIAIVLGAFVVGVFANALWTIFHYNVMLRGMRQVLKENPLVLQQYFGVIEPTPELKHRIESNRAFGTFLFPNALAAYLVLCIPVLVAALPAARRAFHSARRSVAPNTTHANWPALGITLLVGVVVLLLLSVGNELIGLSMADQKPLIGGVYRPYLFFIPIAGVVGGAAGWFSARHGARAFGLGFMGAAVPIALVAALISLWLSYSRGAMLALVLAGGATLLLVYAGKLPWTARYTRATAAAVLLFSLLGTAGGLRADDLVDGYRVPEPVPSSMEYLQRKHLEVAQEMRTLDIEGMDRRLDSLADPNSLRLRFTYWRVALRMLGDNLWMGVGPGNFRTGYPKYQYHGSGSAETAHNDYLQAFCETGLVGGAVFLAFWVYFAVWGGRRLLFEADPEIRRWLAATYCGTGAVAIHCMVDFDLQNPSLSLLAYALAGTFFALATLSTTAQAQSAPNPLHARVVMGALTVVVLAASGAVSRIYFFDLGMTEGAGLKRLYQVGDLKPMEARLEAAQVVIHELTRDDLQPGAPRYVQLLGVLRVVPDITELEPVSTIRVPLPETPNIMQRLKPGQPAPMNSYVFFHDLPRSKALVARNAEQRIAVLREWDKAYPHDAELAAHIFSWYDQLFSLADNPQNKMQYAAEAERWARLATERSPETFIWWSYYAKALWMRGSLEQGELGIDYYRTGLQYYRKALQLFPTGPAMAFQLAQALQKLGEALVASGRVEEGRPLLAESTAMYERSVVLDRYVALVRN